MATSEVKRQGIDQLIADEFGVNADYVSELLVQFERDRSSVDDEWRSFFDELLADGRVSGEVEIVGPAAHPAATERTTNSYWLRRNSGDL
jgi:2-oxoglutarate dehydrogenase complex dehydrogenase (E1) component-like enzyme